MLRRNRLLRAEVFAAMSNTFRISTYRNQALANHITQPAVGEDTVKNHKRAFNHYHFPALCCPRALIVIFIINSAKPPSPGSKLLNTNRQLQGATLVYKCMFSHHDRGPSAALRAPPKRKPPQSLVRIHAPQRASILPVAIRRTAPYT